MKAFPPGRRLVFSSLPKGALVEVEALAVVGMISAGRVDEQQINET